MSINVWFDILADGMQKAIDFLFSIDLGGISLAHYILGIFIMSLCFTLFLHVVNTSSSMVGRIGHRQRSSNRESRKKGD